MNELLEVFDNDDFLNVYLENVKLIDFRADVRKLVESKITDAQQLNAEIAECCHDLEVAYGTNNQYKFIQCVDKLRQLSAKLTIKRT